MTRPTSSRAAWATLAPDATATVTIDVVRRSERDRRAAILENDAHVMSDIFDPTNENNFASVLTTVEASADLEVMKFALGSTPWIAGEVRTYQYDIENTGPSWSRDVRLRDTLPDEVTYLERLHDRREPGRWRAATVHGAVEQRGGVPARRRAAHRHVATVRTRSASSSTCW